MFEGGEISDFLWPLTKNQVGVDFINVTFYPITFTLCFMILYFYNLYFLSHHFDFVFNICDFFLINLTFHLTIFTFLS